jgi:hypothetical protein
MMIHVLSLEAWTAWTAKTKWLKIETAENLEIGGELPTARPAPQDLSPLQVASHVTRAEPVFVQVKKLRSAGSGLAPNSKTSQVT